MKQIILFSLIFLCNVSYSTILDRLSLDFSTKSDDNGSQTLFWCNYNWGFNVSSEIKYYKYGLLTQEEISGFNGSLLSSKDLITGLTLYPIKYSWEITKNVDLGLAAGIDFSSEKLIEKGDFYFNSNNQVFKNDINLFMKTPKISVSTSMDFNWLKLNYLAEFAPKYWFDYSQIISIKPIVPSNGTNKFSSSGSPLFEHTLNISFFNVLGFRMSYDFNYFNFNTLQLSQLSTGSYGFNISESPYTQTTLDLLFYVLLNIKSIEVRLGFGKKFSTTKNISDGSESNTELWRSDFGFNFN